MIGRLFSSSISIRVRGRRKYCDANDDGKNQTNSVPHYRTVLELGVRLYWFVVASSRGAYGAGVMEVGD